MIRPPPVLIFELGRLQVFHYPEDTRFGVPPKEVYWQDKESRNVYGPFKSIHDALTHHTWLTSLEKVYTPVSKDEKNVIRVDFNKKSRIV